MLVRHGGPGDVSEIASLAASDGWPPIHVLGLVRQRRVLQLEDSQKAVRPQVAHLPTARPVATLTWSRRTGTFLLIHGWWDRDSILLSMDRSLVTSTPESGKLVRVARLPRSDIRHSHTSLAIHFPEPMG